MRLVLVALALCAAACSRPATGEWAELRVRDQAQVLTAEEEIRLSQVSERLEEATSDQLVIATIPDLGGQDIAAVGTALGNSWGLGQAQKDNGVLILMAPKERRVRIAVGEGLEGLLTDQRAQRIVNEMTGEFAKGRYAPGLELGAIQVARLLRADPKRPRYLLKKEAA